jgi:uncharacterized protein (DUF2164 family)
MTTIELPKQAHADALASIKRYFQEKMPEPIGDLAAGLLLNYFLEEIGPAIYNRAIADAQARLQQRVQDDEARAAHSFRHGFSDGWKQSRLLFLLADRGQPPLTSYSCAPIQCDSISTTPSVPVK